MNDLVVGVVANYNAQPNYADTELIPNIIKFIDLNFAREGYGFVTPGQLRNEMKRDSVFVARLGGEIVGVRIGKNTVYNLCVSKTHRKLGIGKKLLECSVPNAIRVKSKPVGHLSKDQRDNFKNPEGFYERCGFDFSHQDYSRNFFAGDSKTGDRVYYKQGKEKHIRVYIPADMVDLLARSEEYALIHFGYISRRML